jgi:uncharacterized protein
MRVIDSHVHFPEKKIIDDGRAGETAEKESGQKEGIGRGPGPVHPWLAAERAKWQAAWRFPAETPVTKEEGIRRWHEECRKYDYLERVVFVTAGSNDFAAELVKTHPDRFSAYAHHDPLLADAPERLEKAVRSQGLKGYKILGPAVERRLDDKSLFPLWETAQSLGIPVLIHFGILGGAGGVANHVNINPLVIHDVAKAFPRLPIIIPHFGCGYVFETLNLSWACPNVYIDTSGSNQWMRWVPYELNLEILFRKYRETMGAGRILFGTDSSWFPRGFATQYLDEQVRAMVYVGYSESEVDAVLCRNAAALLRLD